MAFRAGKPGWVFWAIIRRNAIRRKTNEFRANHHESARPTKVEELHIQAYQCSGGKILPNKNKEYQFLSKACYCNLYLWYHAVDSISPIRIKFAFQEIERVQVIEFESSDASIIA